MALEFTGKVKKRALHASETGDMTLFDLLGVWKTWYRDLLFMKVKCPADLLINIDFSHKLKNLSKGIKINDELRGSAPIGIVEYWNDGIMDSGLRLVEPTARREKCGNGLLGEPY